MKHDSEEKRAEYNEMIERAKSGDQAAFGSLYTLHHKRVYLLCLRMVGNHAEAEELAQDVFVHLINRIKMFRGESQFDTWLHRVTINLVLMNLRRRNLIAYSLDDPIKIDSDDTLERHVAVVDRHQRMTVSRVALERAITQLAPGYRKVFVLHDIEGYEHNEIAEIIGVTIGGSKSQLHKARAKLASILGVEVDPLAFLADFDKYLSEPVPEQEV